MLHLIIVVKFATIMSSEQLPTQHADGTQPPSNEDILASLCTKADLEDNKEVRDCLRAYKLNDNVKAHKTAFNKFSKDVLIETLSFLKVTGKKWNDILKPLIIIEVICRIQNLLIDTCNICGSDFATSLDEKLLLQCELCGQNFHEPCLEKLLGEKYHDHLTREEVSLIINPLQLTGFHYLCSSCTKTTIPLEQTSMKSTSSNKNKDCVSHHEGIGNKEETAGGGHDQISSGQLASSNLDSTLTGDIAWRERTDLCSLFLEGTCPYGITGKNCTNFHPRVCNAYRKNGGNTKYGCKKGNDCERFHPKVCPSSLKSRRCYNENCSFKWHLPRTSRVPPNNSKHNNSQSYHSPNSYHRRTDYYHGRNGKRQHTYYNNSKHNYKPSFNSHANGYTDKHLSGTCDFSSSGVSGTGYRGQSFDASRANFNTAGPHNNSNHNSFPFLVKTLQDSIGENIKAALKELNIHGQIQAEMEKFQTYLPQESLGPTQHTTHQLQADLTKFQSHLPQETLLKQAPHSSNYQPPSINQRPCFQQDPQLNLVGSNQMSQPSFSQEPVYPKQGPPPPINLPPLFQHQLPLYQNQLNLQQC